MKLDDLTIGEAKRLATMFGQATTQQSTLYGRYIGQYVIVRSRNEGINAGEIIAADETGIVLKNARRIWYHRPADKSLSWYEGVAQSGVSENSKLSCPVAEKAICEDYSITACTTEAATSIKTAKTHGQN